jgi:hypothetical protein
MVGKVFGLIVVVGTCVLTACFSTGGFSPDPQQVGFIPHVESVDVPGNITVGVPATFILHLSTLGYPDLLSQPLQGHRLFAFNESPAFEEGQGTGLYLDGEFRGLAIDPPSGSGLATYLGLAADTIALTVVFEQAGSQSLYLGHAGNAAEGGIGVQETVFNHGYPPEEPPVSYLRIAVTVLP